MVSYEESLDADFAIGDCEVNMINSEWKKMLFLKDEIYWGDLTNLQHFKKYYFISDKIQDALDDFVEYSEDIECYHPIILAGDAGSGKTSLIHYIYMNNKLNKAYPIILSLDHDTNNKQIMGSFLEQLEDYYFELSKINIDIDNIYLQYKNRMSDLSVVEKIHFILKQHNDISKNKQTRRLESYLNLVVIIDQIDLASIKILEKRIKEIFSWLESSGFIHKVVCARHDTIKLCRTRTNSFFATIFRRQIEVFPSKINNVVEPRIKESSLNFNYSLGEFFRIFDRTKLRIITVLSSNNIRNMIDIISNVMKQTVPNNIRDDTSFINFLMKSNFIPNINEIEFSAGSVSAPFVRWVFEGLAYHNVNDIKLQNLIIDSVKFSKIDRKYLVLVNKENITRSIECLKDTGLIQESIYNYKQFEITKKGELILNFIVMKIYNDIFKFSNSSFKNFSIDNVLLDRRPL
jgi:GTPase SAR1 family protein